MVLSYFSSSVQIYLEPDGLNYLVLQIFAVLNSSSLASLCRFVARYSPARPFRVVATEGWSGPRAVFLIFSARFVEGCC